MATRYAPLALVIVSVLPISAVAANLQKAIDRGQATLVSGTLSVEPFGMNYRIVGVVEAKKLRAELVVSASDCEKGHGSLGSTSTRSSLDTLVFIDNLLLNGTTPADKLFAEFCRTGLPLATQLDDALTPEQREKREQSARKFAQALLQIQMSRQQGAMHERESENHDKAVRDAGAAVADAVRDEGQKKTDCQPNGQGITCQSH